MFGGLKVYLIMGSVLATIAVGGYFYYKDTQAQIKLLTENAAKLETAVEAKDTVIDQMQEDSKKQAELNAQLNKSLRAAESYQDELLNKLQEHDLTRLAIKKPGLIERRINDATKQLFDDLESATND